MSTPILIIGVTQSGKTTFAKKIAAHLGYTQVSASGWLQEHLPPEMFSGADRVLKLTEASCALLAKDPLIAHRWLRQQILAHEGRIVLDGIRNPIDFASIIAEFQCRVFLINRPEFYATTEFEQDGLEAIHAIMWFFIGVNSEFAAEEITFNSLEEMDEKIVRDYGEAK